jgi:hypothetical protein
MMEGKRVLTWGSIAVVVGLMREHCNDPSWDTHLQMRQAQRIAPGVFLWSRTSLAP